MSNNDTIENIDTNTNSITQMINISQNSLNTSQKERLEAIYDNYNNIFDIIKNYKLQCKICEHLPRIILKANGKLDTQCDCLYILNISCDDFFKLYLVRKDDNEQTQDRYCKCKDHIKPIKSYCEDCERDICEECITQNN